MGGITDNWQRLEKELRNYEAGTHLVRAGQTTCMGMMSEVERGTLLVAQLEAVTKMMAGYQPSTEALTDYRSGFLQICNRAGDFLKGRDRPISEPTVRRAFEKLTEGYYVSDFQLLDFKIDPDAAESSTLQNPVLFVRTSKTAGSTLNTIHVFTVIPIAVAEVERVLVADTDQMGKRTTLLHDDTRVVIGKPNMSGQSFTVEVHMDLPILPDRRFKMEMTATRDGVPGAPGEIINVEFKFIPKSGKIARFDGRARISRTGPDRCFVHYKLFVDLETAVPDFLINRIQDKMFLDFARELLAHVKGH